MQDNCNHKNQHCYINTSSLQIVLNTGTQFIFINKKHKQTRLNTYIGLQR